MRSTDAPYPEAQADGRRGTVEVSPDFISTVTDAVHTEMTAWQSGPLEPMYPVVFFDALRVKIRDETTERSKAAYLPLAILPDGSRYILGMWIEQTEGREVRLKVFTDLKTAAAWTSRLRSPTASRA